MDEDDNAYEILGVSENATDSEIQKAWIKMCRKWHPDKGRTEKDIRTRTKKMYKVNEAKTVLMDPIQRAQHDAEIQQRRDYKNNPQKGPPPAKDKGSGYSDGFRFSSKPRPSGLGTPYSGDRSTPEVHKCTSDGAHGQDGLWGKNGWDGSGYGDPGSAGSNATSPSPGAHAGDMKIHLRMTVNSQGFFEVDIQHIRSMTELMDLSRNNLTAVPLKAFGVLQWSAIGGNGGAGGVGGDGGRGADGKPGKDATANRHGSNGKSGGRGGDGGLGTSGADAGRGGDVVISMVREDVYLLMRVEGCHPDKGVEHRVNGGVGGASGEHGRGGAGGKGGRGGSSYSWTTSHRDHNGHYYEISHTNPGGYSGSNGSRGKTPKSPLYKGKDGQKGTFSIKVNYPDGKERHYPSRYNLQFDSNVTEKVSDMREDKTYEFGESVFITRMKVANTGKMETPEQRVLIRFGDAEGVNTDITGYMFLAAKKNIAPGDKDFADQGFLRFDCPVPTTVNDHEDATMKPLKKVTDFDPIRTSPALKYRAYQLGHENKADEISEISDFQARYEEFQPEPDMIQLAYPVENRGGVLGFRSLAPMETSILQFTLKSMTHQELGKLSKTQRELFVHLYYADDRQYEIPIEKITVRAEHGKVVDVKPEKKKIGKGYRYNIRSLPAGADYTVHLSFKLDNEKIQVSEKAGLQLDVYLQDIPKLASNGQIDLSTKKKLIQRRLFVASCQPRFDVNMKSQVLLVTTTGSDARQVTAWQERLSSLGLTSQPYSLSRYGHMDPTAKVEEKKLFDSFKDKLIILLNDEFIPKANSQSERRRMCRPSKLLKSPYELPDSTNFLIVGGSVEAVKHLAPSSTAFHTKIDEKSDPHLNVKSSRESLSESLRSQREEGFELKRARPSSFQVSVKTKSFFRLSPVKAGKILDRKAKKLARWLQRSDPLHPYIVEWNMLDEFTVVEEGCLPKYEIGNLNVFVGPPRTQNTFSFVEEEVGSPTGMLVSPDTISSRAMMYAILHAAPFHMMIRCYKQALVACSDKEVVDKEHQIQIISVVKDCLVGDFIKDVTNYYHGRLDVEQPLQRSITVQQLRYSEDMNTLLQQALSDEALKNTLKEHLSPLMGAFQCVGRSKDMRPWYTLKLFSRKHRTSSQMMEALDELSSHWEVVLDEEAIHEERKALKKLTIDRIRERKKSPFTVVAARGRYRAELASLHSPKNQDAYNHSFQTVRVRHETDVLVGDTMKVKKYSSRTLDPTEASEEMSEVKTEQSYRKSVKKTAIDEYSTFVRTDM